MVLVSPFRVLQLHLPHASGVFKIPVGIQQNLECRPKAIAKLELGLGMNSYLMLKRNAFVMLCCVYGPVMNATVTG